MAISYGLVLKIFVGSAALVGTSCLVFEHYIKPRTVENNDVLLGEVKLLDDSRNEFMDRVWNGITWKNLIDFMEEDENRKLFGELDSTKAKDSATHEKAGEFLVLLEEFLCVLDEYNVLNVLGLNIGDLNKLVDLVEELKDGGSMEPNKISSAKKLFVSVRKEIKEINNYSSFH